MSEMRDRMVEGAMALLARRGLDATSFSEVIAATGAPRGSLYHHFPGGKDEMVAAAVSRAGAVLADALSPVAGQSAEAVLKRFLAVWRAVLDRSDAEAGCAVLAVAVATASDDVRGKASTVFRGWRDLLASLLQQGGLEPAAARGFAVFAIAAVEGAVVLSRAEKSLEPFEAVSRQLLRQLKATGVN